MSGRLRSVACSVRTPIAYRPYGASSGADGVTVSMRFDCASALPARATAANVESNSRPNIVTSTVWTTEETEATDSRHLRDLRVHMVASRLYGQEEGGTREEQEGRDTQDGSDSGADTRQSRTPCARRLRRAAGAGQRCDPPQHRPRAARGRA